METFEILLKEGAKLPEIPIDKPTLLQIIGLAHYENAISNILAFYLDTEKSHGFKDLFVSALLHLTGEGENYEGKEFKTEKVEREVLTQSQKRIDILVKLNGLIIGIENKVYAKLYNDLNDYAIHLEKQIGANEKVLNIVLSLRRLTKEEDLEKLEQHKFINLTYHDYFIELQKRIGHYIQHGDTDYFIHIKELIKTFEKMEYPDRVDSKVIAFFEKHEAEFLELEEKHNRAWRVLEGYIKALYDLMITQVAYKKTLQIWERRIVFCDISLSDGSTVVVEVKIEFKGWIFQTYVRTLGQGVSEEQMIQNLELFKDIMPSYCPKIDSKLVLDTMKLDATIDDVANRLMNYISKAIVK